MTSKEAFQMVAPDMQQEIVKNERLKILLQGYQNALNELDQVSVLIPALIERVKTHEPDFDVNTLLPKNTGAGSNTVPFPSKAE